MGLPPEAPIDPVLVCERYDIQLIKLSDLDVEVVTLVLKPEKVRTKSDWST